MIINEIGNSHRELFKVRKKEIVHTDHAKISKALDSMLEKNKLVQFA